MDILKNKKAIIGIVVGILLIAGIVVGIIVLNKKPVEEKNDVKANDIVNNTPQPTEQPKEDNDKMLDELASYYEENNDTIGWLKIDDTPIDYPVMQTMDDEEFYLKRDFDKKSSSKGTLFIDTDSKVCDPNSNVIIYGHNMKDQSMFGSLKKYADKSYYEKHKIISFNTLYRKADYEVVAAFYSNIKLKTDKSFKYYMFFHADTENDFNYFVDNIKKLSEYDTKVTPKYGDEFITLSTCSYHVTDGRFAVVARKIDPASTTTN